MEFAARVDYVGIGWLISASIATFCWYAFSCRRFALTVYLSTNIACGIAGSILPFMQWFNARKHKVGSLLVQTAYLAEPCPEMARHVLPFFGVHRPR
jgi:adiponectin receptor